MSEHGSTNTGKRFFSKSSHFVPYLLAFILMLVLFAFFLRPLLFGVFRTHIPIDSIVASRETHGVGSYHFIYYSDFPSAIHSIDMIVIGEIVSVGAPEPVPIGEAKNQVTGEMKVISDSYVISKVRVEASLKGASIPGTLLKVMQHAGVGLSVDKFYQPGERYLFLLSCDGDAIPCSVINPEQGDMLIVNGRTKRTNNLEFFHGNVKEERLVDALKEILSSVASE